MWTLEAFTFMLFGQSSGIVSGAPKKPIQFLQALHRERVSVASMIKLGVFAKWLPTPSWYQYVEVNDVMNEYFQELADSVDVKNTKTLFAHCSNFEYKNANSEPTKLESKQIIQVFLDLVKLELYRLSNTACWVLLDIANNKKVQENIYKEIINDEKVPRWMAATIKESMRLHPISMSQSYFSPKPSILAGYQIPHETSYSVCVGNLSLNPNYFPDPLKFEPERWFEAKKNVHPGSYQPFGKSTKFCPGANMATLLLTNLVRQVLTVYELDADPNEPVVGQYAPYLTPPQGLDIAFLARKKIKD